jgi:class 3 adenylate cyclase/tetratricopeptide (TPR) repeat protein
VTGSTALGERLDPESLRRVMGRYFDAMAAVVERHGGTVEKFIGDAIMAVFGIPQVHEDDALRAVRAADEMRHELARLNEELERDFGVSIENRTGVNTGEVVTGDPATGQRLVTGDAVNVAARLEQAAAPGEVLVGEPTYALVRDAVETQPVEPVEAKGKTEPLAAHRLDRVIEGAEPFARRLESPLVGREHELELLRQAYRRAVDEQSCHLFTVLGSAGVGKSRVTQEFLGELRDSATVVTGRCLSYGDGITYWPLIEILEQLGAEETIVQFLEGEPDARTIVNTVFAAVGHAETAASPEETPWAVRKLLEALAREQPLVVVLDDLQWAEPTFLDLVEHVADFSRGAPILLLCNARPELLDDRPGWGGGKLNATSILLEPLTPEAADTLIENLLAGATLPEEVRSQVGDAAEGNPFFVEQMLAMLGEDGGADGEVTVPPTIQALLAARLDRLDASERMVIERCSVVGKEFWLRAVMHLSPRQDEVAPALQRLVRKELIRPHRSTSFPREDTFRFRHILILDAAYAGMPKELRAELHEGFADWLAGERSEFDEIVGYHLEQAYRYRSELGPVDSEAEEIGRRAGELLGRAGMRARERFDMPAAVNLLERALALLPADDPRRSELRLALGDALIERDFDAAERTLGDLIADTEREGDGATEWRARVTRAWMHVLSHNLESAAAEKLANQAIEALTELGDQAGLARAWRLMAISRNMGGDIAGIGTAMQEALVHAERAGDAALGTEARFWIGMSTFFGPKPAAEARVICEGLRDAAATPLQQAHAELWLGAVEALQGSLEEGIARVAAGRARYAELGLATYHGGSAHPHGTLELLRGDPVAAERIFRDGIAELEVLGDRGYRSTLLAYLGEALYDQGKYDAVEEALQSAEAISSSEDVLNFAVALGVRGKLLARAGRFDEAEAKAREGIEIYESSLPFEFGRGDAYMWLAEVLQLAGRAADARDAAAKALGIYEAKGVVPAAEHAFAFLAELQPA